MDFHHGIAQEFETVDILLKSKAQTKRTDAFILSWVKMEKQLRKLFVYLVYQSPSFSKEQVEQILSTIAAERNLYYESFVRGFDALYEKPLKEIVGLEYDSFQKEMIRIKRYRNKILHGQVTGLKLKSTQLESDIRLIRRWISLVAEKTYSELGYDGLGRNSCRKSPLESFFMRLKVSLTTLDELKEFICRKMTKTKHPQLHGM